MFDTPNPKLPKHWNLRYSMSLRVTGNTDISIYKQITFFFFFLQNKFQRPGRIYWGHGAFARSHGRALYPLLKSMEWISFPLSAAMGRVRFSTLKWSQISVSKIEISALDIDIDISTSKYRYLHLKWRYLNLDTDNSTSKCRYLDLKNKDPYLK